MDVFIKEPAYYRVIERGTRFRCYGARCAARQDGRYRRRRAGQSAPVLRAEISSPENSRVPVGSRTPIIILFSLSFFFAVRFTPNRTKKKKKKEIFPFGLVFSFFFSPVKYIIFATNKLFGLFLRNLPYRSIIILCCDTYYWYLYSTVIVLSRGRYTFEFRRIQRRLSFFRVSGNNLHGLARNEKKEENRTISIINTVVVVVVVVVVNLLVNFCLFFFVHSLTTRTRNIPKCMKRSV